MLREIVITILVTYGCVWVFCSVICFIFKVETDQTYHFKRDQKFYNRHFEDSLVISLFWPYHIFKSLLNGLRRMNQEKKDEH